MNLYFRLLLIIFKSFFTKRIHALEESVLEFRAWLTDCDMNLHVTNSRYLSFMDLGRTYLVGQVGLLPQMYKRRWGPVIQATELTFLKPIMIGQRFKLVTRLVYWDEKYFYMEQRFIAKGQLVAHATVRGLFVSKKQKVATKEIIEILDANLEQPVKPEFIEQWQAMHAVKKEYL